MIKLRELRIKAGVTPTELAKEAGISDKTVRKIEGKNLGKPETKNKMLKAYHRMTGHEISFDEAFALLD